MRRIAILAVLTTAGLFALAGGTALGVAAKFHSVSSSVNSAGALVVSFDERGLGNGNIDYTLTADATATYACINGGGKNPAAANKRTVEGSVRTGGSFESKNGRVAGSLTTGPLSRGGFSCPHGQRLVLARVSYTNILLTDTTNGSSTAVPDASRTFFAV
jgi:hypothetical protein